MAINNGINYAKQFVTKPSEKIEKGEQAGKKRVLIERFVLNYAVQVGDTILGPKLPAYAIVTGAKLHINKSLGVTGIFKAGHLANGIDAADSGAFVASADAGGQAALGKESAGLSGLNKTFQAETQLVIECTEVMDGSVLDGQIELVVEYIND